MNRLDILTLLGFNAKPEYIGMLEVLSIPPKNEISEERLCLNVYNKLHNIELELEYITSEHSGNIWECKVLLENDKFKSAIVTTAKKEEVLNLSQFKNKVLSVLHINLDKPIEDTLDFSL